MKKLNILFILILLGVAQHMMNRGYADELKGGSMSFELGGKNNKATMGLTIISPYGWGISMGGIDTSESNGDNIIMSPLYHNNYTSKGDVIVKPEAGFDVVYQFKRKEKNTPFLNLALGLYQQDKEVVVESNYTGLLYAQDTKTHYSVGSGIGVGYLFEQLLVGVVLHTKKGMQAQIGLNF